MSEYWFHLESSPIDPWWMRISAPNFGENAILPCSETDPELFFPEKTDPTFPEVRAAKAICSGCSFQVECLEYAMAAGSDLVGIWGGTTQRDRLRLRRKLKNHV